ncbi:ankyrin repeat domain-containing protein SOWAHC-like [Actinia tenebrosa]|uniref:Ankyrin repeat domain-containing protein SOWAHC-like n=1 Tax=Actinia tenebrosa TaxID=6105 RepID=A0A6P8IE78_ACTTE|nr:ankyrin repeat domain-containing protein SOWAHC-like [Actinia tenebrosa]
MSGNEPISIASVRDYMLKNNSQVRNHDLVTHFRQQLNDPANKNKVRGEFKEIVHQLATVQEINGEKYFVLKKPKEAPAVLRKPPRQHTSHKSHNRPVSGPPVMRNTKMFEDMLANQMSKGHPPGTLGSVAEHDKENKTGDVRGLSKSYMMKTASMDSIESTGSGGGNDGTNRKISGAMGNENEDRLSQISVDELLDDQEIEGDDLLPTIQLEPIEKEWILTAARGNRANIMCLLEQDSSLAKKKTALHWAAKHGREDIVAMLAAKGADVNAKSHGGYTPLHLASMHGNDKVIKILIEEFNANINTRDYSGRKPRQVAKKTLTIEAQGLLENILSDKAADVSSPAGAIRKKSHTSKQYSSVNSIITPSAALVGFYGGELPMQQLETPPDKQRDRASSLGKFLHKKDKKKHKKEQRAATADIPPEYATPSAGLSPSLRKRIVQGPGAKLETNVVRSSFRRLVGTTLERGSSPKGFVSNAV